MVSSDPFPRGLNQPKCPVCAQAREPAAFNAHKLRDGAGGLVQHVFHLPARMPITEPRSGRPVRRAAKRKTLSVIKSTVLGAGRAYGGANVGSRVASEG
jgi:hypothetical protein